jgi:hypothetical protein
MSKLQMMVLNIRETLEANKRPATHGMIKIHDIEIEVVVRWRR